jgi:hypothetical protein
MQLSGTGQNLHVAQKDAAKAAHRYLMPLDGSGIHAKRILRAAGARG